MFKARLIEVLTAPLPVGARLARPEKVILWFGAQSSFDFGAFCYLERSEPLRTRRKAERHRPKSERLVNLESFSRSRTSPVRALIRYFSDLVGSRGLRFLTVEAMARQYVRFISWAEKKGFPDVIQGGEFTRPAFAGYVEYLRERVNCRQISVNTAAITQQTLLGVLADLTGIDNLHHGINLLSTNLSVRKSTQPPSEADQARVLALCKALFDGLSTLCLDNQQYPFRLSLPKYLGFEGDGLWVLPARRWCMPPHMLMVREKLGKGFWAFNYEEGRVATVNEISGRYTRNPRKGRKDSVEELMIKEAQLSILAANQDCQHICRRQAALLAHNVFLIRFLANTSMNWSDVTSLRWSKNYQVSQERQGFRTIKYRAGGKKVSFEVQSIFNASFKRYLEVRDYLLKGKSFRCLFFAAGRYVSCPAQLKEHTLYKIFDALRWIDPHLPNIFSRAWRAGKSDWLIRKTDISTAAIILQNSESTTRRSYAAGSPTTQAVEMGLFFDLVTGAVIARNDRVENGVERAVGTCSSFKSPNQPRPAPIKSDCRGPEGCLFCDKLKVHADERDTRKLLSCRYCIEQTADLSGSEEQFNRLFMPILNRIDALLNEIELRQPGMPIRIRQEVEKGELDRYWAGKLEMLISLDLIG
jgi:hypothetical protein